jgi:hypothetical protein
MNSIHKLSAEAFLPELDLFTIPSTQKSIERSYETQHRPISTLESSNSMIDFHVPTSEDEYVLLHETYLYAKIQISAKRVDDKPITKDDWKKITPVNNFLHSMIKKVELSIGNKDITLSNELYSYRAYIENLLGFALSAKNTHLGSCLWEKNEDERRAYFTPTDADLTKSKIVDLYGRLHIDLTFQGKALVGGCDLKIKIIPNSTSFVFVFPNDIKIEMKMLDASLFVHRLKATQHLVTAHAKALAMAPVKYPISRVDMRQMVLNTHSMDVMIDNIVIGQLPRRIFLTLVSHAAFNGASSQNPFDFKHYNLTYAACYLDGVQYPSCAYQPDFANNLYVREYNALFQAMNMNTTESSIDITRKEFGDKHTIMAFNFAPDLSHGCSIVGHVNPIKRGTLRLYLRFKEALTEMVDAVLFCEYDNLIEVDVDRNVHTDYN